MAIIKESHYFNSVDTGFVIEVDDISRVIQSVILGPTSRFILLNSIYLIGMAQSRIFFHKHDMLQYDQYNYPIITDDMLLNNQWYNKPKSGLPSGINPTVNVTMSGSWVYPNVDWTAIGDESNTTSKSQQKDCHCGAKITYGKDCDDSYHSDYCPIGILYNLNKDLKK